MAIVGIEIENKSDYRLIRSFIKAMIDRLLHRLLSANRVFSLHNGICECARASCIGLFTNSTYKTRPMWGELVKSIYYYLTRPSHQPRRS